MRHVLEAIILVRVWHGEYRSIRNGGAEFLQWEIQRTWHSWGSDELLNIHTPSKRQDARVDILEQLL